LTAGGIGKQLTIYLGSHLLPDERRYTNWHETAHFLYLKGNPSSKQFDARSAEVIADLGALIFLDMTEVLDEKSIKKYKLGLEMNHHLTPNEIIILFNVAKRNKQILRSLVLETNESELVRKTNILFRN
jgi:hypothetical protein